MARNLRRSLSVQRSDILGSFWDAWLLQKAYQNSAAGYVFATGFALGNPSTRLLGRQMASFGFRASVNWYTGAFLGRGPGLLGTTVVRGGSMTAGTAAVQVAAAVAIPVAVGYAISYAIDENEGVENFTDFITGGVSPQQYIDAVTLSSMR